MLRGLALELLIPLLIAPIAGQDDVTARTSLLSCSLRVPARVYMVESS